MRIRPRFRRTQPTESLLREISRRAAPVASLEELLAAPVFQPAVALTDAVKANSVSVPQDNSGRWLRQFTKKLKERRGLLVSLAFHVIFGCTLTVVAVEQLPHTRSPDLTVTPGGEGEGEGAGSGDAFAMAGGGLPHGDNQAALTAGHASSSERNLFATPAEIRAVVADFLAENRNDFSILPGSGFGGLRGGGSGTGAQGAGGGSGGGQSAGGGAGNGVGFFGTSAPASSCVYVVDMSGSMRGRRFRRAVDELSRSIAVLGPDQRFFVIMFSDTAVPLFDNAVSVDLLATPHVELLQATPENKRKARAWLQHLRPRGMTYPSSALKMAIDLHPDIVFFLTDGEIPEEVPAEVSGYNTQHVPVHAIEFEETAGEQRLRRLSSQNFGTYRYVR